MVEINDWQKGRFVRRVISSMFNTIRGKRIAVLGFAYKAHTTDTRDTAAIDICRGLLQDGAQLAVYDPKVRLYGGTALTRVRCCPTVLHDVGDCGWDPRRQPPVQCHQVTARRRFLSS